MSECSTLFYTLWWLNIFKDIQTSKSGKHQSMMGLEMRCHGVCFPVGELHKKGLRESMSWGFKIHFIFRFLFGLVKASKIYSQPQLYKTIYYGIDSHTLSVLKAMSRSDSKIQTTLSAYKISFFSPGYQKSEHIGEGKLKFLLSNLFGVLYSSWPYAYIEMPEIIVWHSKDHWNNSI